MSRFERLFDKLNFTPKNLALYEAAFTHPSVHGDNGAPEYDYERLEFLGDSVLGLVLADIVYRNHPELNQGGLTKVRTQFAKGYSEASFAADLNLISYVRVGKGFVWGEKNKRKILEDVFESLIGAIYLDQGFEFTFSLLASFFGEAVKDAIPLSDPKTTLQEALQAEREIFEYRILHEEGPANLKTFVAAVYVDGQEYGRGVGKSKQEAETNAAKDALSKFAPLGE